jgi:DNA polymerase-3 subunit alpha
VYYPLHVHTTTGSVGDSVLKVDEYVKKGKEYGLDALAITDHGSLGAMYEFYDACREHEIKPIIGMEAYVTDDNTLKDAEHKAGSSFHLVLLAKNQEGLKNLLLIHNNAAIEGFYYKPRTDWDHLEKWGKGIIALSACVAGEIPQAILEKDTDKALDLIGFYRQVFDEFYLELQPGEFDEQRTVNQALIKLAEKTGTPLVVTNDVHYLNMDDAKKHDYHVKLGRHSSKLDEGMVYPDTCYWFMDEAGLREAFKGTVSTEILDKALANAENIAGKCQIELDSKLHMPEFDCGDTSEVEYLRKICYQELGKIIESKANPQEYTDRLEYELEVIREKGFSGYFLVVADYIDWARKHDIPVGPGRGSASGSLVTYLLGICQADPIEHKLLFERFLDPHREAAPDIDVDFGVKGRNKVFDYVVNKYGYDNCALVSTITMRKAKGAVHDAARILGYEPKVGNEIAQYIPEIYYGDDGSQKKDLDIASSLEVSEDLKRMEKAYPDIISLAMSLEGLPSTKGIHAAGILISPTPLSDVMPLAKPNREGIKATALTLGDAEKMRLKYDFLGLASLDLIRSVEEMAGWKYDFRDNSLYEDKAVWNLIGSVNTDGIFQIASKTYKARMPRLRPKTLDELAACLALVRGPCISAKTDELYMQIEEGTAEVEKVHPLYDEITRETNGILVFQEQIMHLAVAFGMDLSTGYRIIKASSKKKFKVLEEYREQFLKLAKDKNCSDATANKIFDMIVDSGKYSFNRSHAVSYGQITYATAYLKVHFPLEFACALLTHTWGRGKDKEYSAVYQDCLRQGIHFLPADAFKSQWEFTIEDGKIRVGLCAIKGLGEKAASVLANHQAASFTSIEEFMDGLEEGEPRIFNKKAMAVAIFSGLFDSFGEGRADLYKQYMEYRKEKGEVPKEIKIAQKLVIYPFDDDLQTLEEGFCSAPFVTSSINDMEPFGWDKINCFQGFANGWGQIKSIKRFKNNLPTAHIEIISGDGIVTAIAGDKVLATCSKNIRKNNRIRFAGIKKDKYTCFVKQIEKEG